MALHQAEASLVVGLSLGAEPRVRFNHEAQALEFRRKMQAREDNRLARELALAGDPDAVLRVERDWDALRPWQGWDPERKVLGEPV